MEVVVPVASVQFDANLEQKLDCMLVLSCRELLPFGLLEFTVNAFKLLLGSEGCQVKACLILQEILTGKDSSVKWREQLARSSDVLRLLVTALSSTGSTLSFCVQCTSDLASCLCVSRLCSVRVRLLSQLLTPLSRLGFAQSVVHLPPVS